MTKPGGESLPLGKRWFQSATGEPWYETRFHRGRVVLTREGSRGTHTIRVTRRADDPGTGASILEDSFRPVVEGCSSCPDVGGTAETDSCPQSQNECGHHCSHSWSHDKCCWCKREWGEGGEVHDPA